MYYEGGIRVPFIACWPGTIKPGTVQATPIINVDMFATFMDVSKKAVPSDKILDGKSLVSLFKQEKELEPRAIFWHFPGYLDKPNPGSRDDVFRSRAVSTIRKGDWKLLLFHEEWVLDGGRAKVAQNNSVELYNLKTDLSETKNLANTDTRKRDEMLEELLKMMKHTGATMPTEKNPLYQAK
jgi:arylsulfatase A-like enzyme